MLSKCWWAAPTSLLNQKATASAKPLQILRWVFQPQVPLLVRAQIIQTRELPKPASIHYLAGPVILIVINILQNSISGTMALPNLPKITGGASFHQLLLHGS